MLDENAGSKFDNIGMNAMANKDKAGEFEIYHSPCLLTEDTKTSIAVYSKQIFVFGWLDANQKQPVRHGTEAMVIFTSGWTTVPIRLHCFITK